MSESKKEKKFEDAVRELETIVAELESGELDLDKSATGAKLRFIPFSNKYTEAMKLIEFCENKLNSATTTINKLVDENGKITDFEIEE